ncbi:thiolase family protein [Croceicoccus sp. BE223]|uniref:thiolase family protein n=1 Tax=Croceicoccus sp. BE223 TaxID=2817716 RepID=UPI00285B2740|nr:thiolase family protein [Croceicoccus sp. BE223]MDR7101104.1 acetyl-CoA acyltransferase [Croceicoccus sp. BE223]
MTGTAPSALREVCIVDAVRTPIGRFRGALAEVRADHLAAGLLNALAARNGLDPAEIDDVVFGCVTQVGEQCGNIARTALLSAGWPDAIPGMTVDRKCGSSEAALHTAAAFIASGMADLVVAGGAESMSRVPMGGNRDVHGEPFGWMLNERFALSSQGEAAERISDIWHISRADHDDYAMESHRRAAAAADAGHFANEIVPVDIAALAEKGAEPARTVLAEDETIRRDTNRAKLDTLKRVFRPDDGRVSAGNASQICDGASVVLLASRAEAERLGLRPRARIVATSVVGSDPELMLTGPMRATREILAKTGLALDDIDLFEVNEAFASVPIAWMKELGVPGDRLNVNGGAIALGHPLGATGARLMTTMLNELERRGGRHAMQAICCAGGMGTATLIERLD